ncbi:hypothetical protein B7463_g8682, partial [Scytalidium lignicola]
MPGKLETWPTWPEYNFSKSEADPTGSLLQIKQEIISEYGESALRQAWLKVCSELSKITDDIAEKGTDIIPEVNFDELFHLDTEKKEELKDKGCFVVRGVVDKEVADGWFAGLKEYVEKNKQKVIGWPAETPSILRLYWSPTQLAIRSHPNQLRIQKELNSWWHDDSSPAQTSSDPLTYVDAVRIRPPGIPFFGLGPHIDAGSLCRWGDKTYRSVYSSIFSGNPEKHDPYDLTVRQKADQALYQGSAHSTVLRSFQGWTALTTAGKQEGSLLLYPNVKVAIAYLLLRPFFSPPNSSSEEDILDASKWTFDANTPWFPGTFRETSQYASLISHPHLKMRECMVHIPTMHPGDTIWWHADMIHAVEVDHFGSGDSSVAYVAATPTTDTNVKYIKGQLKSFLDGGRAPEDFWSADLVPESEYQGYLGEGGILSGEQGRKAMGFGL